MFSSLAAALQGPAQDEVRQRYASALRSRDQNPLRPETDTDPRHHHHPSRDRMARPRMLEGEHGRVVEPASP